MSTIGQRLKTLRKEERLTQVDFAKRLLISQSYLSSVENDNETPTSKLLKLASLEFGVNEKWLLDGSGQMYENDKSASTETANSALLKIVTLLTTKSNVDYEIYVDNINIYTQILFAAQYLTGDEKVQFLSKWHTLLMNMEQLISLSLKKEISSNFNNHTEVIYSDLEEFFQCYSKFLIQNKFFSKKDIAISF